MSKRFTVTVPDLIGQMIEAIAKREGSKSTSVAAYILETAVKENIRSGIYSEEWVGSDDEETKSVIALLKMLLNGVEPPFDLIADVARQMDVAPHEIAKLKKEGNGHAARSNH